MPVAIRPARLIALFAIVVQLFALSASALAFAPAIDSFNDTWMRTDKPVADAQVVRTWMWGPEASTDAMPEPYLEAPGTERTVQYFDKSRMEDNSFNTTDVPWYVTNGLLVVELTGGRMQLGDNTFLQLAPAEVNVAGDADDPTGPTYATFGMLTDEAPAAVGSTLTHRVSRAGVISDDPQLAAREVTAAIVDDVTNHAIAAPFWNFMNSSGGVLVDGQLVTDTLFLNSYYATGRPISEAYWANVKVNHEQRDVLMQCFERRCLTYTPENAPEWQVEMGNVGQHYLTWRYESGQAYVAESIDTGGTTTGALSGFASIAFPASSVSGGGILMMVPDDNPPANPPWVPVSRAVEITLAGAHLTGNANFVFLYNPESIPAGVDETQLRVAYYDEGAWHDLSTSVDSIENTATVTHNHASIWQVFAPPPSTGDQAPYIDLNGEAESVDNLVTFHTGDPGVAIMPAMTIIDLDSDTLASATVTLTNPLDGASESLSVPDTGVAIDASYDPATGVLSLTGTAPIADYQAVLASVVYANDAITPTTDPRSITVVVNDGTLNSNQANVTVAFDVDRRPLLDLNGPANGLDNSVTFHAGDPYVLIMSEVTITDPDSGTLAGATVTLTNLVDGATERINVSVGDLRIEESYDSASGDLILTGEAPIAAYEQVLANITYTNTAATPSTDTRTISVVVTDGTSESNEAAVQIVVDPNHRPMVDLDSQADGLDVMATLKDADSGIVFAPNVVMSDPDNGMLASATLTLTNPLNGADEYLFIDTSGTGITPSWDPATSTLTLSGVALLSDYQIALANVAYINVAEVRDPTTRTIEVVVNDGNADSATAVAEIEIEPMP